MKGILPVISVSLGVGILASVLYTIWRIADPTTEETRISTLQIMAGVGGASILSLGSYIAWKSLNISREGQITERFTRAIDQLGSADNEGKPRLEVRLGGIYALERIARDSDRDYQPIIETLTAYVRQNVPVLEESDPRYGIRLSEDIAAIVTVLVRRQENSWTGEEFRLDLSRTNLYRANFAGADLRKALFNRANLYAADFRQASLNRTFFVDTDLSGANFFKANLTGAYLSDAVLDGANFHRADLTKANLVKADLRRATLNYANLTQARLYGADLRWANFDNADLTGANLAGADLTEAVNLDLEQFRRATIDTTTKHSFGRDIEVMHAGPDNSSK